MRTADLNRQRGLTKNMNAVLAILLLYAALCWAQNPQLDSVPIWPADGKPGPELSDRYVFLSADRRSVVVLEPTTELGVKGPKQPVHIPLGIGQEPAITAKIVPSSKTGSLLYRYTVRNRENAHDPIGTWALIVPADPASVLSVSRVLAGSQVLWTGAAARAAVAHQVGMRNSPVGRLASWFHQTDQLIRPGGSVEGFDIESRYLPGLTTAFVASGKAPHFKQSWPAEIFKQLEFYNDRAFREPNILTVGPAFAPDSPFSERINNFAEGIAYLLKVGYLQQDSHFINEVASKLPEAAMGNFSVAAAPRTELEHMLADALRLSLGMRTVP